MTTMTQPTATIHQFPLRGRFAQTAQRGGANDLEFWRTQTVAADSSWYHDEAIEDERRRKS